MSSAVRSKPTRRANGRADKPQEAGGQAERRFHGVSAHSGLASYLFLLFEPEYMVRAMILRVNLIYGGGNLSRISQIPIVRVCDMRAL